jgi:hypothetical protein
VLTLRLALVQSSPTGAAEHDRLAFRQLGDGDWMILINGYAATKDSRCELFDRGGHAFMAQEPARLASLINSWLGR